MVVSQHTAMQSVGAGCWHRCPLTALLIVDLARACLADAALHSFVPPRLHGRSRVRVRDDNAVQTKLDGWRRCCHGSAATGRAGAVAFQVEETRNESTINWIL